MRVWTCLLAALALGGCYDPQFRSNPDANMGFRCFASDTPPCPENYICCAGQLCGEELLNEKPNEEGWCVPPRASADLTVTPVDFWDFGTKTNFAPMTGDPMLTGYDDEGMWRCPRDDQNPSKPPQIAARLEPNDTVTEAINAGTLATDNLPDNMSAYEICPDKSAPNVADVDVIKFRISQARLMIEVKYQVNLGDLDVALFRDAKDQDGKPAPQRIMQDTSAMNDACIVANNLQAGTYYAVVRGAPIIETPGTYAMNNYRIRIAALQSNPYTCAGTANPDMQ